jgi:hypothetical protein
VNLRLVDDDKEQNAYTQVSVTEEPLLYIFLCILRDLPSRRSLGSYVVGEIPLYFYVPAFPRKDFLMGWIRKIQKHKEERDRSGKFKKTRRKEWRKEKEEIFTTWTFPYLCVLH